MSKIVKLPNAKPITCACCGCVYEFESGDTVEVLYGDYCYANGTPIVISKRLSCPNCHFSNEIEFEKENCDNEQNASEQGREIAYTRNLTRLICGEFGIDKNSPKTLLAYWKAQALAGYPLAEENVRYFEEMVRKESGNG